MYQERTRVSVKEDDFIGPTIETIVVRYEPVQQSRSHYLQPAYLIRCSIHCDDCPFSIRDAVERIPWLREEVRLSTISEAVRFAISQHDEVVRQVEAAVREVVDEKAPLTSALHSERSGGHAPSG